jgi:hypothetical protein
MIPPARRKSIFRPEPTVPRRVSDLSFAIDVTTRAAAHGTLDRPISDAASTRPE